MYKILKNTKELTIRKTYACDYCDNLQIAMDMTEMFVEEGWDEFYNTTGVIGQATIRHYIDEIED